MTSVIIFFICLLALFYYATLIILIRGLFQLKPGINTFQPFVSIVVAARDEEMNISDCINSLRRQTYPMAKHEIIIVNDRSTDRTAKIVDTISKEDPRIHQIHIKKPHKDISPKKWALHMGILKARGEIVLFTDADCRVPPGWVSSMIHYFKPEVGLVAGFSPLILSPSPLILFKLIALDSLALAAVAAGSFGTGYALTCSGRNLAYRKSVYMQAGGFDNSGHIISGDDDLLMHNIRNNTEWKLRFAIHEQSIVPAKPPDTIKQFISQRIRHASKGRYYTSTMIAGLVAVYLLNVGLLVSLVISGLRSQFLLLFSLKSLGEFFLVLKAADLFHKKKLLWLFPVALLIHIFYVIIFGFLGQTGKYTWKGQRYRSKHSKAG